jgi:zinc protease
MTSFERYHLANGLTFLYRQSPGVPLSAGTVLIPVGSSHEKPAQAGLANLTTDLLLQGTRRRSARTLAEDIESVGASLGSQASEDYTEMGFVTPDTQLPRILDVLVESLAEPVFPNDEIKKERDSVLAALESRQDSIFSYAYDAFNARFYGNHAYGRPVDGKKETVQRLTPAELKAWHRDHLHPQRSVFSLIGSMPSRDARRIVEKYFKNWKKSKQAQRQSPTDAIVPEKSLKEHLSGRFEQSYLMTGVAAPTVRDADFTALKVLNVLFGGGMSSRLFLRLREQLGLAYEVSSFFPTHLLSSQWVIYLGLPPQKLPIARKELEKMLVELQRQAPRPEEVRQAIAMIQGSYLMDRQTRRRQAWAAAWGEFLGRPLGYDRLFLKNIERVTPAQLHTLARKLLSQPRLTIEVAPTQKGFE